MIGIGNRVPFQPGLLTVTAEIIGTTTVIKDPSGRLDFEQYILLLEYERWDNQGNYTFTRRYYYRDRKLIEGLTADSRRSE